MHSVKWATFNETRGGRKRKLWLTSSGNILCFSTLSHRKNQARCTDREAVNVNQKESLLNLFPLKLCHSFTLFPLFSTLDSLFSRFCLPLSSFAIFPFFIPSFPDSCFSPSFASNDPFPSSLACLSVCMCECVYSSFYWNPAQKKLDQNVLPFGFSFASAPLLESVLLLSSCTHHPVSLVHNMNSLLSLFYSWYTQNKRREREVKTGEGGGKGGPKFCYKSRKKERSASDRHMCSMHWSVLPWTSISSSCSHIYTQRWGETHRTKGSEKKEPTESTNEIRCMKGEFCQTLAVHVRRSEKEGEGSKDPDWIDMHFSLSPSLLPLSLCFCGYTRRRTEV